MGPRERLQDDLKAAMKSGDVSRRDTLRLVQAAIRQIEVDKRITMNDEQVYDVLSTEAKKRRDSITEARNAGRGDIAGKEQAELELIESYLPQQLSREDLEAEVRQAIAESGAKTAKEMGAVMKVLMPRVKNRADGKLVNEVVRALLGG